MKEPPNVPPLPPVEPRAVLDYRTPPQMALRQAMLTPEQLQQLSVARVAGKKIRTAANVALFDGWTIAIFAGLSFICGLGGVSGPAMGVAMGIIAAIELRGAARLRRLEAPAARMLGFNQLALALLLIVYALWSIYSEFHGKGVVAEMTRIEPAAQDMLKDFDVKSWARMLTLLVYGSLILIAITAQGGTALYYFSRVKHVSEYVKQTPAWIIQMQQAGVSV